jgi:type II secretory pathway component GspD/PulD (secretin)
MFNFLFRILLITTVCSTMSSAAQDSTQLKPEAGKEQLLSVDVKDTDIRDVIRMISKGYNLNILLDQAVSGKILYRYFGLLRGSVELQRGRLYSQQRSAPINPFHFLLPQK